MMGNKTELVVEKEKGRPGPGGQIEIAGFRRCRVPRVVVGSDQLSVVIRDRIERV